MSVGSGGPRPKEFLQEKPRKVHWSERRNPKTKTKKTTTQTRKNHLLPSDSSSAKAARHCLAGPHLTILGTPRLWISGLMHRKPKLQRSLMFPFPDLFFFFFPFRDMNFPSRHSACLFLAEAADVRGGGVKKAN